MILLILKWRSKILSDKLPLGVCQQFQGRRCESLQQYVELPGHPMYQGCINITVQELEKLIQMRRNQL